MVVLGEEAEADGGDGVGTPWSVEAQEELATVAT